MKLAKKTVEISKKALVLGVIASSAILLTGCSKKNDNTPAARTTTTDPVTLTIWRTFDDESTFTQTIANYQQIHPNVKIVYVKKDLADYETQSLNALAAGTGPDIWSIKNTWLTRHSDKLSPMPDNFFKTKTESRDNVAYYKATWAPVASQDNIINDKIYGIPLYIDTLALYVNTELWTQARSAYRKANVDNISFDDALFRHAPATWNELLDELPYLTKKDSKGNITQGGIALGTSNNIDIAPDVLSLMMMQNNTKMSDPTQKSARFNTFINDANNNPIYPGTNALNFYTSFAKPDRLNYTWNSSFPNSFQAFTQGKVAIIPGYQYITQQLSQAAPTLQYDIYPMPQVKDAAQVNYASYWTETVTNNSRNADVAWDFLAYMASRPNIYTNSAKRTPALYPDKQLVSPYDIFANQVLTATDWAKGKSAEKVDDVFKTMIENVVAKNQPLQQSIDSAAGSVTEIMQKE